MVIVRWARARHETGDVSAAREALAHIQGAEVE